MSLGGGAFAFGFGLGLGVSAGVGVGVGDTAGGGEGSRPPAAAPPLAADDLVLSLVASLGTGVDVPGGAAAMVVAPSGASPEFAPVRVLAGPASWPEAARP